MIKRGALLGNHDNDREKTHRWETKKKAGNGEGVARELAISRKDRPKSAEVQ